MQKRLRYIDIAANLTDGMFQGLYNGKHKHAADLEQVLQRAAASDVTHILVTGSCLQSSREAIDICRKYSTAACRLYATVGVHPCSAATVPKDPRSRADYYAQLESLSREPEVRAFGEFGLDYDRLHYASRDEQLRVFDEQLPLAVKRGLPLFLHSRNASADFYARIGPLARAEKVTGVVHSFTGAADEADELLECGLYIGLNGCSLRSDDNLRVAARIPLRRLLLETDAPWCDIRPTHPSFQYTQPLPFDVAKKPERNSGDSMVKGRSEPCSVLNVARVYAAITNESLERVANTAYENALEYLGLLGQGEEAPSPSRDDAVST